MPKPIRTIWMDCFRPAAQRSAKAQSVLRFSGLGQLQTTALQIDGKNRPGGWKNLLCINGAAAVVADAKHGTASW